MKSPYFTEEHYLFRDSVRKYINKIKPQFEIWEKQREIPKSVWKEMAEMGYLGLIYPEKYGGLDADFFYSVILMEELSMGGNGGFGAAFSVHSYMATNHINNVGTEDLKQKYLVPSIAGDLLGAIAFTEPNAGSDLMGIKTTAKIDGDDYVINGSKLYITNGFKCDYYVTLCKTENGFDLIVIDGNAKGVSRNKLNKIGWHSSDTAEVFFQDVRIPISNRIGEKDKGFYYVMDSFQLERLCCGIMAVGAIELTLDITLQYLNERKAFGREVSKFQALRHILSDYYTDLEAVKQLVYYTSWQFQNNVFAVKEASMCKLMATELQNKIVGGCLQMHGGAGYMDDYLISRLFRDSKVGTIIGGTSEIMKEIIAKIVIDKVNFEKVY